MAGTQTDNLLLLDLTTGLARTTEQGGTPDVINTSVDWEWVSGANVVIDGNLTVNGTTTTIHSEQVNIRDNHLYLNADYTATVAQTGGLVINVLPTATADTIAGTFVAGVAATSNPTVQTIGSATFAVGDIIQIAGANDQENDNIYEVLSHIGTTLTIRGIGLTGTTVPWVANDFAADVTAGGDVRIVNVNVLEGDSSGNWSTATTTTTTGITYNTFTTQGLVDLQEAYEQGNTITTSVGEGDVTFAGTETFIVTTSGGINLDAPFDFDSTSFDVQMTGTNGFSIDGTAASNVSATAGDLTLSTITSGALIGTSAAGIDLNATTTLTADTADAANASGNDMTFTAGSSTAGTADGASIILTPGDGFTSGAAGFVNITSPADEDEILLQIESTGSGANAAGFFTGTSNPDTVVTADAGSIFLRDTGTGAEAYLNTSTGSGTSWTVINVGAGGDTLQTAYIAGNTITTSGAEGDVTFTGTEDFIVTLSDMLVDTTASISLDADAASNFTVDSAGLTLSTTTSGTVAVSSAGILDLDATTTATLDTANAGDASGNDITVTAGSSTAGTNAGASIILTPGDGFTTGAAGSVDILSPADEDEAVLTLTSTGTSGDSIQMFVGDNDPSGSVTGLAGSLFFRDTGAGGELYLNQSTGSGTAWTALSTGGAVTLQNAYVNGNTITTSGGEGDVTFTGTEDFIVTLSDMLVDTTAGISLDADAASNFTVDGGALTLSTTTSGSVLVDGIGGVEINSSGGALDLGNDANTGAINVGTGAAARTITLGNSTGATGIVANVGTGEFAINSTVGEADPVVTLTTTGTGGDSAEMFVGDSDPNGSVTGLAGSLFMRDTATGGELYINNSTGSGTVWLEVATTADVDAITLQQAYVNGNTIVTSGAEGNFDVSGTEAISLDASSASNFTVDSAALSLGTTTSGAVSVLSAGILDLDAATALSLNSSGGAINVGNDANTGAINVGTGAAARTITIGNATGATGTILNVGTGELAVNSTVGEADPVVTWTTTGTGGDSAEMFVGDSDPDGSVTGLAGSLFMRDTATGGELYINDSTGSGTSWDQVVTVDGGNLTLQQAYVGGNTITTSAPEGAFDVSGTEAISLDAGGASNFSVAGANLTLETTTSGTIDINSAADIDITFATANATALVIDDGSTTYMTFDSTVAEPAVEVSEFLDIVGSGAGVTLTAGEALSAGDVVTIEGTTGDVILADSNTGTTLDGLAIGVAAYSAADTAPVKVFTVPGSLIPVNFAAAPAAALNGRPVFVSQTGGQGTTTAPTGSGNVVYIVGILQGADGASTSPLVMYQPQFIAVRP